MPMEQSGEGRVVRIDGSCEESSRMVMLCVGTGVGVEGQGGVLVRACSGGKPLYVPVDCYMHLYIYLLSSFDGFSFC